MTTRLPPGMTLGTDDDEGGVLSDSEWPQPKLESDPTGVKLVSDQVQPDADG